MDYLIVEEFNRFWELFAVNERLYPHRRACFQGSLCAVESKPLLGGK